MPRQKGFAEDPQAFQNATDELRSVPHTRLKVDNGGRIVIPAEMRSAMMVEPGDIVTAEVVEGEFRIISPAVALKRFRAVGRAWQEKHPGVDLVEDLIEERREEARREDERYDRLEREAAEAERKRSRSK